MSKDTSKEKDKKKWTDVNYKFCKDTDKQQIDEHLIQKQTSWEDVDWDHVREQVASSLVAAETECMDDQQRKQYEDNAMDYWDKFYHRNQDRFFKDRTYLHLEYSELNYFNLNRPLTTMFFNHINGKKEEDEKQDQQQQDNNEDGVENGTNGTLAPQITEEELALLKVQWDTTETCTKATAKQVVMEIGCGVGNTVFPLIKLNPDKYFYAFDFSPHAVSIVKTHPLYDEERITGFVCDIATEPLPPIIQNNSIDVMMAVFVFSAISFERMDQVASTLFKALKPGGVINVRDYGLYDMTHLRFLSKKNRKIDQNFYLRPDGTRTYFFTLQVLTEIFEKAGFKTVTCKYDTRELRNRKKMISMYRVWIRGKFMKPIDNTTTTIDSTSTDSTSTTTTTTTD